MIFEDMQVKIRFINSMCGQSFELCFLFEYNVSDQEFLISKILILQINRPTWVLVGSSTTNGCDEQRVHLYLYFMLKIKQHILNIARILKSLWMYLFSKKSTSTKIEI